jgi:phage shock protein C
MSLLSTPINIFLKEINLEERMVKKKLKRLYRSKKDRIIAGVCAGIGEYFNLDPVLIRLLWVIGTLIYGAGILAYIIAWIIIPEKK